jgi:hypothetical protein
VPLQLPRRLPGPPRIRRELLCRPEEGLRGGGLQFLFVGPLSASGHLAPRHALLEKAGLRIPEDQVSYTCSHLVSLEVLAKWKKGDDGKVPVAFVFDEAEMPRSIRDRAEAPFKRVKDFPGLADDDYLIPQNVWVAGPRFEYADKLKILLQEHKNKTLGGAHDFANRENNPEDRDGYRRVSKWTADLNLTPDKPQFVTLDAIHSLLSYHRSEYGASEPPRLALVLSGGGPSAPTRPAPWRLWRRRSATTSASWSARLAGP